MKTKTKKRLKFAASVLGNPVKSLDYFRHYHDLVEHIALNGTVQKRLDVVIFVLFQAVMIFKAIHHLYLAFFSNLTIMANILNFDGYYVVIKKVQMNVIAACATVEALYLNRTLIMRADRQLLRLLRDVMLRSDWSFFVEQKFNGKMICDQVRRCFLVTISASLGVTVTAVVFYLVCCVYFWLKLYENRDNFQSLLYLIFVICLNFLNGLGFLMVYFNYALMYAYNFCPMITLVYVFYIKIVQCYRRLFKVISEERFSLFLYAHYWRMYIRTLNFFFKINRMYGKLFFIFLIFNCPRNVTLTVWLMQKNNAIYTQSVLCFWIVHLGLFLFLLHLVLAFVTKHIHRPCKPMFKLMMNRKQDKFISSATRIRLALNLFALHSTNRYGFTYGDFGLVSLNTFSKFLMLYGKFIIIFYKLMQKKVI